MRLVEPFDDRQRLGQRRAVVEGKRRNKPLRIELEIVGRVLLALTQMMRHMIDPNALDVECDARPPGCGAAIISVKLQ
jgi:hypothetical protein